MDQGTGAGKRRAEEEPEGGGGNWKGGRSALGGGEGVAPSGPRLGGGPVWRLRAGKGADEADNYGKDGALFRCGALLEQALSCSPHADVRFVFDDGKSLVCGHRGMLCCVSGEFDWMFRSGVVSEETGEVRVPGVGRESFRGFLEYLYLGRPGKEMGAADGREVWMLADMYDVPGIKEWLLGEELDPNTVCAAVQYSLGGSSYVAGLLERCKRCVSEDLSKIAEETLRGVSAEAAGVVLEAYLGKAEGAHFVNSRTLEGLQYVERWAKANGGLAYGHADIAALVAHVDLAGVCPRDLQEVVRPCGLVSEAQVDAWHAAWMGGGRLEGRRLGVLQTFVPGHVAHCAVGECGGERRVATCEVDDYVRAVHVYDVGSGARVLSVGVEEGPGKLGDPRCVAFSDRGELFVSDVPSGGAGAPAEPGRVCVFDWGGRFVREMGRAGGEGEQLGLPSGVAVCAGGGDVVVADQGKHRVAVYRADGTFVRAFGSPGKKRGQFNEPRSVAVGRDGRIVVADYGNKRVQVLSAEGSHLLKIGAYGESPDLEKFSGPECVALSAFGELLITDKSRCCVHLFSPKGQFLRSIWKDDIRGCDLFPEGVAVDAHGRMFVHSGRKLLMLA